jgi:hypothetical protein
MQEQGRDIKEYLFATIDARTEHGARVTHVATTTEIHKKGIAVVGEVVTNDDGSQARIVDGAGFGAMWSDKPIALLGSRLDNGDRIISTPQSDYGIKAQIGETVPGLFDSAWRMHREVEGTRTGGGDV